MRTTIIRGQLACALLENLAEILGVGIADPLCNLVELHLCTDEKFPCFHHPVVPDIGSECFSCFFVEMHTQIFRRDIEL